MFFSQEDYKKIQLWLQKNAIKDTEFNDGVLPLNGEETIALVQNKQNIKVFLKDFIAQLALLGSPDFINISDKFGENYISLSQAIKLIPYRSRKIGQVITFLDEFSEWRVYQFQGERVNQWNNTTLWIDLLQAISDSSNIVPDEEDITGVLQGGRNLLKFKDKNYNKDDYSGLGRVFLRKNLTTVTDPSTMCKISTNLLTQEMVSREYTIYIIQYDYTLNGNTIVIPKGSILDFQGGSIDDGTLSFEDDTKIKEHFIGNAIIEGNPYYIDYTPDEEDITIVKDIIKFKDKEYNASEFSGLGRVYLRKNISNGKNILTQNLISKPNTIYIIQYDYDLNGAKITIPENCVLDFQGGSFSNGIINGNKTVLKAPPIKIISCTLQGTFNTSEAYIEWFGGKADNNTDCLQSFNIAINNFVCIKLLGGTYLVSDTLNIPDYCSIYGEVSTVITTNNDINYLLYVERGLSYEKNKARWNNFTIDCNNKANYGIYAKNITNNATAFLQNIEIFNAVTCGLHLEACQLINLYNVLVSSSADKGIVINGCNNARIYNISAIRCEGDGITITRTSIYSGHLYIFGIYSENNNGNGVYIDNINYGMSLISGGWIEGNAKDGVYINNSTFLIQGLRINGVGANDNRGLRIIGNKTQVDNIYVARSRGDTTYGEIYLDGNSFVRNNLLGNGNYNISTLSIGNEENLIYNNTLTSDDKWETYQVTADYNNSEHVNSKSTSLKLTATVDRGLIMTYINGINGEINISAIVYAEVDITIIMNIFINGKYKTEKSFKLVGGQWNNISFKAKISANFIYRIGLLLPTAQTSVWVDEINAITQLSTYISHEVYGNNYLYSSLISKDAIDCTELDFNINKGNISFQPTNLTFNDYGFLFFDNTNKRQKVWNGTEFRRLIDAKDIDIIGGKIPDNLTYNDRGFMYFYTTLNKPIWWTGSKWVDATGTDV